MKERFFESILVRALISALIALRGAARLVFRDVYGAISDTCWLYRVPRLRLFGSIALPAVRMLSRRARSSQTNPIADAFLRSREAGLARGRYSLGGHGELDLFRDIIVLKSARAAERGVVLLKYTPTFDAFMAYFAVDRVLDRYYLVLEPSWAGYCDPSILMYASPRSPVVVQCFMEEDYAFITRQQSNLRALRLGPADWINPASFHPREPQARTYDLVMVANWGRHKQHSKLFEALGRIHGRSLCVLLIGFPWGGRTKHDLLREAAGLDPRDVRVEILENLSHEEVASYLARSKVFVYLSKKEGDNKALVEALLSDVPAIAYEHAIGGARSRINDQTGILSSYEDLAESILFMLDHLHDFSPRQWALRNVGSSLATRRLNDCLRSLAAEENRPFVTDIVEKCNAPNLAYRDGVTHRDFDADYAYLASARRTT